MLFASFRGCCYEDRQSIMLLDKLINIYDLLLYVFFYFARMRFLLLVTIVKCIVVHLLLLWYLVYMLFLYGTYTICICGSDLALNIKPTKAFKIKINNLSLKYLVRIEQIQNNL